MMKSQITTPNNCVLAVFGDINTEQVLTAIREKFSGWKAGRGFAVAGAKGNGAEDGIRRFSDVRDKKQGVVVISYEGTTIDNPDRYPLELLQEACSDLGSRLFLRIREKLGLAYDVGISLAWLPAILRFTQGRCPKR